MNYLLWFFRYFLKQLVFELSVSNIDTLNCILGRSIVKAKARTFKQILVLIEMLKQIMSTKSVSYVSLFMRWVVFGFVQSNIRFLIIWFFQIVVLRILDNLNSKFVEKRYMNHQHKRFLSIISLNLRSQIYSIHEIYSHYEPLIYIKRARYKS